MQLVHSKALATALRFGLLEVGKARIAMQDQHEKTELVYNYLPELSSAASDWRCRSLDLHASRPRFRETINQTPLVQAREANPPRRRQPGQLLR